MCLKVKHRKDLLSCDAAGPYSCLAKFDQDALLYKASY